MEFKDYYEILGLKRDANQDEVKRAYRKQARKFHPDVSKESDAENRFKEVGEAYEVLKDPEKRVAYDQLGSNFKSGQNFRAPPDWDQGFEFHGKPGGTASSGFSDFFENLFAQRARTGDTGSRAQQNFHVHGEDTYAKVLIDIEDAYHGATRTLTLKKTELSTDGRPFLKEQTLRVKIPKGVQQGQLIRLANQGSPGIGQGKTGDLYLEVQFREHAYYHVNGRDVTINLPITPWEAALGATVISPTPAGSVELKIPADSAGGQKLRLKGKGIPGKVSGDLYVLLQIALPPSDSEATKAAYRKLEKSSQFNPRANLGV